MRCRSYHFYLEFDGFVTILTELGRMGEGRDMDGVGCDNGKKVSVWRQ